MLAWVAALLTALALRRFAPMPFPVTPPRRLGYWACLVMGSAIGAYGLGTLNLWLAGLPGVARSIEGALLGAIVGVELYKRATGITERTGARFALPIAVGIGVGRIGCFLAGLDDFTHGTPTDLPWGHDFGDGIPRHPVQLYETAAMAGFALVYLMALLRRRTWPLTAGFALFVVWYGAQRFVWEFFKPYASIAPGLTLFHFASIALVVYALLLLRSSPRGDGAAQPAG